MSKEYMKQINSAIKAKFKDRKEYCKEVGLDPTNLHLYIGRRTLFLNRILAPLSLSVDFISNKKEYGFSTDLDGIHYIEHKGERIAEANNEYIAEQICQSLNRKV